LQFHVLDEFGRKVVVEERHSIIILIAMVLLIIGVVIQLIYTMSLLLLNPYTGFTSISSILLTLVYVFVLNHLRRKADMDVKIAKFKTLNGKTVVVRKISSFWFTLGSIIVYVLIAFAIIGLIASIITLSRVALLCIVALIVLTILARVLNFLRTRLDYEGEVFRVVSEEGVILEFYKERSFWITLALIITIIEAIAIFLVATLITTGLIDLPTNLLTGSLEHNGSEYWITPEYLRLTYGIGLFIAGIFLLITAAMLNFLRICVHVKIASTSYSKTPSTKPIGEKEGPPLI